MPMLLKDQSSGRQRNTTTQGQDKKIEATTAHFHPPSTKVTFWKVSTRSRQRSQAQGGAITTLCEQIQSMLTNSSRIRAQGRGWRRMSTSSTLTKPFPTGWTQRALSFLKLQPWEREEPALRFVFKDYENSKNAFHRFGEVQRHQKIASGATLAPRQLIEVNLNPRGSFSYLELVICLEPHTKTKEYISIACCFGLKSF